MAFQNACAANTVLKIVQLQTHRHLRPIVSFSSCSSAVARIQSPGSEQRAEHHILQKNVETFSIHSFGRVTLHDRPTGTWETGRCERSKLRCGNFSGQHVETKQSGGLGVFLLWAGFSVCARGFICRLLDLLRVRRSAAFFDVSLCCPADSAERQKRMASAQFLATVSSLLPLSVKPESIFFFSSSLSAK